MNRHVYIDKLKGGSMEQAQDHLMLAQCYLTVVLTSAIVT